MVTLPCAWILAHGKVTILRFPAQNFAVCQCDTRQSVCLGLRHTAKIGTSPCAWILAHGEVTIWTCPVQYFAVC